MDATGPWAGRRFTVTQRATLKTDRYLVTGTGPDGSESRVLAYAEQRRFSLREELTFYTDETKSQVAFTVRERTLLDPGEGFDVLDAEGKPIGAFHQRFFTSLVRSTWVLEQPGAPDAVGRERNRFVAVLRRAWDWLPLDLVPFAWPYHFDFESDGKPVMTVDKKIGLRDRYLVEVTDPGLDLRLAVAQAVALDTFQGR
ncbi:hypothetical protein GCM10010267_44370 [Streptomyces griseorubens]|uniref:hypothetical protein n=1 Tax=Streptomyces althioticus group TaxID=2867194 RepID=UPI00177E51E2|nr:hypothetical protein OHA53_08620 [Streptomyces althioticus]GGQ76388.1 hypothetical protein GCM10010267_44370 [Streptomyces griseorubens]